MKKVYLDVTQANMCISVYVNNAKVVLAGTSVASMSVKHKNSEYHRFAEEYDIQFIFDDNVPKIEFYAIPMVEIFAVDSTGGYICSLGQATNFKKEIPICYIDKDRNCYLIADKGNDFLKNISECKLKMTPYMDIEFFDSLDAAKKKYEFLNRDSIEQELKNVRENH